MIGVVGQSSRIATEFAAINTDCTGMRLGAYNSQCDRFLVCSGLLVGQSIRTISPANCSSTFAVNFAEVAAWCDSLLELIPHARICLVGSESGYAGSFDMAYAGAKAALHLYVETKRLQPDQQLVAISPGIISDAGMTTRRTDTDNLAKRQTAHPKGRFVTSREVASLASWLLGPDGEYVSGTVVRMNGGDRR